MTTTKKRLSTLFCILAACCFSLMAIYDAISYITNLLKTFTYGYYNPNYTSFLSILVLAIEIGFVVTLFLRSKIGATAAFGTYALLRIYYLIQYVDVLNALSLLAYLTLLAAFILALMRSPATKYICFIAGAILLIAFPFNWIMYDYFSYLSDCWKYILFNLHEITGVTFVGLWLFFDCPTRVTPINIQQ